MPPRAGDIERRPVWLRPRRAGPPVAGAPLRLTPKDYDLLPQMPRHAGRVLTHRQILTAVWGPAHAEDTQYLRVLVGQLRQKIEPDPTQPALIVTEPGIGYRLVD